MWSAALGAYQTPAAADLANADDLAIKVRVQDQVKDATTGKTKKHERKGFFYFTDDGDLAHRLTHPSFEVPKTYLATLKGEVPRGIGRRMREGVELDDGPVTVLLELQAG